jgi:CHAD domain-containing protein
MERISAMKTIHALLLAQLEKSVASLQDPGADDRVIHEVRRELKRARAALRLMRECLGRRAYRRENMAIRDAAKPLGAVRDRTVLLNWLSALKHPRDSGPERAFGMRVARTLQRERFHRHRRSSDRVRASIVLRGVIRRLAGLPAPLRGGGTGAGIVRVYKAGRRAFTQARQSGTDANLHEWRKQVKYLFNQINIVSPISGGHFANLLRRSDRLAECLGQDHDLAVLLAKIIQVSTAAGLTADSHEVRVWTDRVQQQRDSLQRAARELGKQLYARRPRDLRAKIDKCFKETRRVDRAAPRAASAMT